MTVTLTLPAIIVFLFPLFVFFALWGVFYFPLARIGSLLKTAIKLAAARIGQTGVAKRALGHARWKGFRPYLPIAIVIVTGAAAAFLAGSVFFELSRQVNRNTSAVYQIDHSVRAWFMEARQPVTTTLLRTLTFFGGALGLFLVMSLVAAALLWRQQRASAFYVVLTGLGGMLLNVGLKMLFARSRPEMDISVAVATWYSFPSGHAMGSFILYSALAYVGLRLPFSWKVDSAILAAAITMIVLIGLSRVYLGVHWTSDIAGGWSAGVVWVAATTTAFEMLLRLRQKKRGAPLPSTPAADIPDKPLPA